MTGLVEGKVALVTGAAGGIGAATARLFAAAGGSVLVVDRNGEGAEATAAAIRDAGGDAEAHQCDVTDEASVEAMVARAVERFGRLDAAHNNAGISGVFGAFTDLSLAEWDRMIAVNLTSVFLCMKHELRVMKAQGSGAIVNTSSGAGLVPAPGLPHYTAAKHGVLGITKVAAQEHARAGIRVNAVCPGSTDTPMLQGFMGDSAELRRMITGTVARGSLGTPEEIGHAVVWLLSDQASFVSGSTLVVDGGGICR